MRKKPKFTIFAGVNGAGKTSLYNILIKYEDLGVRVNVDEMVAAQGSWKDTLLQVQSTRKALSLINECIAARESFHLETTLNNTIIKQVQKAHEAGFAVHLYFVGIENLQTAFRRVARRVSKGGHDVDKKLIKRRFEELPGILHTLIPMADAAFFYDNTLKFRQIAYLKNNVLIDYDFDLPVWFWELIARNDVQLSK